MYHSNRDPGITQTTQRSIGKNVERFIREKCVFSLGASTVTQDAYDKYVRYCNDNGLEYSKYIGFAKAFRYFLMHEHLIGGIGVFPINYQAYKDGVGYVAKQGWAYSNLAINY